jgi:hypothetical protein
MINVKQFAKRGYDDKLERDAALKLFKNNKRFQEWFIDYAKLNPSDLPCAIISNPLNKFTREGKPCGVDLGFVNKFKEIKCLVEVDVLYEWKDSWPTNYFCLSRLGRKEKYYINTPYPYINISFSADHKNGMMTTREIESQYPIKKVNFRKHNAYDMRREIPLSKAIKVGEWA